MLTPRNLLILGAALLAQSSIGGGFSGLQQMQAQGESNRQTRATQEQEANKLRLSQDLAKQKDTIAEYPNWNDGFTNCFNLFGE